MGPRGDVTAVAALRLVQRHWLEASDHVSGLLNECDVESDELHDIDCRMSHILQERTCIRRALAVVRLYGLVSQDDRCGGGLTVEQAERVHQRRVQAMD